MSDLLPISGPGNRPQARGKHKPRQSRPKRRIRVLEQPTADADGWGAVSIQVGKEVSTYLVHFIPSDFGFGAIGFEVEKLDADLATISLYHVHLSGKPADRSCTCKGCEKHGHCKHHEGLDALRQAGKLPPFRSAGDFAANEPAGYADHVARLTADEYPDEPPQLPPWADYHPDDDGPDRAA